MGRELDKVFSEEIAESFLQVDSSPKQYPNFQYSLEVKNAAKTNETLLRHSGMLVNQMESYPSHEDVDTLPFPAEIKPPPQDMLTDDVTKMNSDSDI